MITRTALVWWTAAAIVFCARGGQASLLDGELSLKDLNADVVFYISFDDESGEADMSTGENKATVDGKPVFETGVSGKAFRAATFRYEVDRNLQVDKPGALSFWLCPHEWVRGDEEPLLPFFMTDYKGDGFLGIERQGQIIKDGKLARAPGLLFWAHYFKDLPSVNGSTGCDWKDGEWHFIVLTWRGPKWEVWVDGKLQIPISLPRPIKQEELSKYFLLCGNALMDEFTIYRRPLTSEEIVRIDETGRKKR